MRLLTAVSSVFLALLLNIQIAFADDCATNLMPAFTAYQARALCYTFIGTDETIAASVIPGTDNAYDLGSSTKSWRSFYVETSLVPTATSFPIRMNNDANRLFTLGATTDTTFYLSFGDATNDQELLISSADADGDDNSILYMTAAGAIGTGRGSYIASYGLDYGGADAGGDLALVLADGASATMDFEIENASSSFRFRDTSTGNLWTLSNAGNFIADATNGGSLIISRATKGLIIGKTALPGDAGAPTNYIFSDAGTTAQIKIAQGTNDNVGVDIGILKSRATDGSGDTIIQNGDILGNIIFYGSTGTTFQAAARIRALSGGAPGASNDMPGLLRFSTVPDGSGTLTAALDIDALQDSNFFGNVIINVQDEGLQILSGASLDADVTAVAPLASTFAYLGANSSGNSLAVVTNIADAGGGFLKAFKTRAAANSWNANTVINNGDGIFSIVAYGADGDEFLPAVEIALMSGGAPGNNDMPGQIIFATTPDGTSSVAAVLTLAQDKAATFTGTVTSSRATDLGWSWQSATDQACNTTCTSACAGGINVAAGFDPTAFVACTNAAADVCLCAGAS